MSISKLLLFAGIIFMNNAEILEVTNTKEFFTSPKTNRAKEFLSNMI